MFCRLRLSSDFNLKVLLLQPNMLQKERKSNRKDIQRKTIFVLHSIYPLWEPVKLFAEILTSLTWPQWTSFVITRILWLTTLFGNVRGSETWLEACSQRLETWLKGLENYLRLKVRDLQTIVTFTNAIEWFFIDLLTRSAHSNSLVDLSRVAQDPIMNFPESKYFWPTGRNFNYHIILDVKHDWWP